MWTCTGPLPSSFCCFCPTPLTGLLLQMGMAQPGWTNVAVCRYNETVEATCNDGVDNDCNGLVDCYDPACGCPMPLPSPPPPPLPPPAPTLKIQGKARPKRYPSPSPSPSKPSSFPWRWPVDLGVAVPAPAGSWILGYAPTCPSGSWCCRSCQVAAWIQSWVRDDAGWARKARRVHQWCRMARAPMLQDDGKKQYYMNSLNSTSLFVAHHTPKTHYLVWTQH